MVDFLIVQDTIFHGFELDEGRRSRFPFVHIVSM